MTPSRRGRGLSCLVQHDPQAPALGPLMRNWASEAVAMVMLQILLAHSGQEKSIMNVSENDRGAPKFLGWVTN